jgi:hypothetical protein
MRPLFAGLEFLRRVGIAKLPGIEVNGLDTNTVLHFALAEVMQVRPPVTVLLQIFGYAFR